MPHRSDLAECRLPIEDSEPALRLDVALSWVSPVTATGTNTSAGSSGSCHELSCFAKSPRASAATAPSPLPLPLIAALHRHKALQLDERMLAGSEWHDDDLAFAQANGRPIDK